MPRRGALVAYKELVQRDFEETSRDNKWLREEIKQVVMQNEALRERFRVQKPGKKQLIRPYNGPSDGTIDITVTSGRGLLMGKHSPPSPYCVLSFDDQVAVGNTTEAHATTSPQWNDHFTLNVPRGSRQLVVTCHDADRNKNENFMGRAVVNLTQTLSGRYWIDLLPRSASAYDMTKGRKDNLGAIYVNVRYVENKRSTRAFPPPGSQINLHVVRADKLGDKARGRCDPFVQAVIENVLAGRTPTVPNNRSPTWNHRIDNVAVPNSGARAIQFKVLDESAQDLVGVGELPLNFEHNQPHWLNLSDKRGHPSGQLLVSYSVNTRSTTPTPQPQQQPRQQHPVPGAGKQLDVHILRAEGLKGGKMSKPDPFVAISWPHAKVIDDKTSTVKNTTTPAWNSVLTANVPTSSPTQLVVATYDADIHGKDDLIGTGALDFRQVKPQQETWVDLVTNQGRAGRVLIKWNEASRHSPQKFTPVSQPPPPGSMLDVTVTRGEGLKGDPYAQLQFPNEPAQKQHRTQTKNNSKNPVWNENIIMKVPNYGGEVLEVSAYDDDYNRDDFLGKGKLPLSTAQGKEHKVDLITKKGKYGGSIYVTWKQRKGGLAPGQTVQVHCLRAEGLNEGSGNFDIDPFVELGFDDEEVGHTRSIRNSTNPEWDQIVNLTVPPQGANDLNVWVVNKVNNDSIGTAAVTMGPPHWAPNTPQWIPLDHQQQSNGRLLLSWWESGKGGRAEGMTPTIDAGRPLPPGTELNVSVIRGTDLMPADGDETDPYVEVAFTKSGKPVAAKTRTIKNDLNPEWNESFKTTIPQNASSIFFTAKDKDTFNKDDLIGVGILPLGAGLLDKAQWIPLQSQHGTTGRLYVKYSVVQQQRALPVVDIVTGTPLRTDIPVEITVIGARNLTALDSDGASDPYVNLAWSTGAKIGKTDKVKNSNNPVWNATMNSSVPVAARSLRATVKDDDTFRDDVIGEGELPLNAALDMPHWINLVDPKSGAHAGQLGIQWQQLSDTPVVAPSTSSFANKEQYHTRSTLEMVVIEGKDIIKKDKVTGSDPYVKLAWGNDNNFFFSSQAKKNSSEPQWNETVPTQAVPNDKEHVALLVYDKDKFSKDDFLGYVKIPLDPKLDGDKWFPLVPRPGNDKDFLLYEQHGKNLGKIRINYKYYHVEGKGGPRLDTKRSKPVGHIPTVLILTVDRAENLISRDFGGKSDPYVQIAFNDMPKSEKSKVCPNTLNPTWHQKFKLEGVSSQVTHLTFTVWDHDLVGNDDFLGQAKWSVQERSDTTVALELQPRPNSAEDEKLLEKHKTLGKLIISAQWVG